MEMKIINRYAIISIFLIALLPKMLCAHAYNINWHFKKIVDIRKSYDNPLTYKLSFNKNGTTGYYVNLSTIIRKKIDYNKVILDSLNIVIGENDFVVEKLLSEVLTHNYCRDFLWDTTSFYVSRSSDSTIVSICQNDREKQLSDEFTSFYSIKIFNIYLSETKTIQIRIPRIKIIDHFDSLMHLSDLINAMRFDNTYFYNGLFSLILGRIYDAYFFFLKSSYLNDDYFFQKACLENINNLSVFINQDKITNEIDTQAFKNTGKEYAKKIDYLPSIDSLYTIKKITYNKECSYYTIIAKSNYGKTYRIISFENDTNNSYDKILEEGKQYKLAIKSAYILLTERSLGGIRVDYYMSLGNREIKLKRNSNYFFAFNLSGIKYKEVP